MSLTPESTPGDPAEGETRPEAAAEEAERLPLRELDRALAPIRRTLSYALSPAGERRALPLGANLVPHAARASALGLPSALAEPVSELLVLLAVLDELPAEERRLRMSDAFALLHRVDALAGLPLRHSFRPVPKPRQEDRPEEPAAPPEPAAVPSPAPAVPGSGAARASELREARPELRPRPVVASVPPPAGGSAAPDEGEPDEEDDEPAEFAGDLSQALVDVVGCPAPLASALLAAGIETVRDLAWCRPSRSETLAPVHGAGRELPSPADPSSGPVRAAVGGRIGASWSVFSPSGARSRWSRLVGAGPLAVRWASAEERAPGRKVVLAGAVEVHAGRQVLVDAEVVRSDDHEVRIPGWGLPEVEDREVRALWDHLAGSLDQVRDPVPTESLRRADQACSRGARAGSPVSAALPALGEAILQAQILCAPAGRRRLAFDEALIVQLAGILPRLQPGRDRAVGHAILSEHVARLGQTQDLLLGDSAQAALEDIKRDLRRHSPMRRLLVSEVGAGKGRIALLAAVTAAEAKSQVLVVGADATDAENRLLHAETALREVGLVGRLLGPSPGSAQRDALRRGEVHVAFCAPELLDEEPMDFRRLGLVIAFERDQFGRAAAWHHRLQATPRPHLLVVPTIPVGPRVLTTAYADFHVSLVRDEERRPARISLCRAVERVHAYLRIREAVERGEQGVVVFPMVEGRDAVDIPEALRLVRALEADALRGLRVALLHGSMPREEQTRVHEDFSHRRVQVLVSTTRVEDAPTVPGASVVVIEQADRVDQWRLHRIIGFFSRSRQPADALLVVGEAAEPDAAARIDRVVSAPDGFQLTESLVRLRGIERCVHPASAPAPSWRWFEPDTDLDLLLAAREEAHQMLRQDPVLRRGGHAELAQLLRSRWNLCWPDGAERGWTCLIREDQSAEPRKKRRRRRRRR